ncbi:MAG: hypothetical protein ACI4WR_01770 [Bulleidia sp.]
MSGKEELLQQAMKLLGSYGPEPENVLLQKYQEGILYSVLETGENLDYLLFCWPEKEDLERMILLAFHEKQILADCSALHGSVKSFLEDKEIYDFCSEESDWMYLEHYILSQVFFRDYPYPPDGTPADQSGEALLFCSAYVTEAIRGHGVFRSMMEMMKEAALRNAEGSTFLFQVISLDPDIACYGPDAGEEEYHYSMEKDEPARQRNAEIMKQIGFTPIQLEETDPQPGEDGTKIWFAVCRETDRVIDYDPELQRM